MAEENAERRTSSVTQLPEKPVWARLTDGELKNEDVQRNPLKLRPAKPRKGIGGVTSGPLVLKEGEEPRPVNTEDSPVVEAPGDKAARRRVRVQPKTSDRDKERAASND